MNYIKSLVALVLLLTYLTGCDNTVTVPEVKTVGPDAITELSLSPESPVLVADGRSQLTFLVRCYYQVGKTRARMLDSRVPLDQITITSSEGKSFKPTEPYTTTTTRGDISFTARIGDITSDPVTVKVYPAEAPSYEPLVVPVRIYAFYEPQNSTSVQAFTLEALKPHFQRLSDVFSGKLNPNGPVTGNPNITFDLQEVKRIELKGSGEFTPVKEEVKKRYLSRAANEISIWLMDGRLGWRSGPYDCIPTCTTGDPKSLPGLKLKEVALDYNFNPAKVDPKEVGIFMSFFQLINCMNNGGSYRLETIFSNYYGLISTETSSDNDPNKLDGDFDYCPDTYSYKSGYIITEKRTFPYKIETKKGPDGKETERKEHYYFYNSTNVMDQPTAATTITRDQAARIRQVIRDCPLRHQGL